MSIAHAPGAIGARMTAYIDMSVKANRKNAETRMVVLAEVPCGLDVII
jgi:hypothetical protein